VSRRWRWLCTVLTGLAFLAGCIAATSLGPFTTLVGGVVLVSTMVGTAAVLILVWSP
jgi:hypothetical protein